MSSAGSSQLLFATQVNISTPLPLLRFFLLADKKVVHLADNKVVHLTDNKVVHLADNKVVHLADNICPKFKEYVLTQPHPGASLLRIFPLMTYFVLFLVFSSLADSPTSPRCLL
jgi:hypothetical protein